MFFGLLWLIVLVVFVFVDNRVWVIRVRVRIHGKGNLVLRNWN